MKVTDDKDREELAKKYEIPGKTFTWTHGYQRNHSDIKDRKHPDLWLKPPVEEGEKKHETVSPRKDGNYIKCGKSSTHKEGYALDEVLHEVETIVDERRQLMLQWYQKGFFDMQAIRKVCDVKKSQYDDDSLHRALKHYAERYGMALVELDKTILYPLEAIAGRFGDAYGEMLGNGDDVLFNRIYSGK